MIRGYDPVAFAIVHHANQQIITNGYENRAGLEDSVGQRDGRYGYLAILALHRTYKVPFNLHLSGTLLEALLWYRPDLLEAIRELHAEGLCEFIGSTYAQNIMRFFSHEHNLRQLNEELALYQEHLNVDPAAINVFWPPERVWDTAALASVLTDSRLLNGGFEYVLVDDRLRYPIGEGGGRETRREFDRGRAPRAQDFSPWVIQAGNGLIALPISKDLRWNIPPRNAKSVSEIEHLLDELSDAGGKPRQDVLAIYADDMEKAAGVGSWDKQGPAQFTTLLLWTTMQDSAIPVKLSEWMSCREVKEEEPTETGTFIELSHHFDAGEGYEKWYFGPEWKRYRSYYEASEAKVIQRAQQGANVALIELAWRQLFNSVWETAWHTPDSGPLGDPRAAGKPSPWIRAAASHGRHSMVTAEAAFWMSRKKAGTYADLYDIDGDGEEELILKNDRLFAVFTPRWGGRLVYLFNVEGVDGKMVIGNPCDDWNWMEELNRYMKTPANHPGALTELGFESDEYAAALEVQGAVARASLENIHHESRARGLRKRLSLKEGSNEIAVHYELPAGLSPPTIEFGFSPDYLSLLRKGSSVMGALEDPSNVGYTCHDVSVWLSLEGLQLDDRCQTAYREFGHGRAVRLTPTGREFTLRLGSRNAYPEGSTSPGCSPPTSGDSD